MANRESSTHIVGLKEKPRVHIDYQVQVGNAMVKKEIPFVMGVMADLSGQPADSDPAKVRGGPLAKREFKEVTAKTFDKVMEKEKPRVAIEVANKLTDAKGTIAVDLTFKGIKDFSPGAIAEAVPALKEVLDARSKLKNLLSYMKGRPELKEFIMKLLKDPALLQAITAAPNPAADAPTKGPPAEVPPAEVPQSKATDR